MPTFTTSFQQHIDNPKQCSKTKKEVKWIRKKEPWLSFFCYIQIRWFTRKLFKINGKNSAFLDLKKLSIYKSITF